MPRSYGICNYVSNRFKTNSKKYPYWYIGSINYIPRSKGGNMSPSPKGGPVDGSIVSP